MLSSFTTASASANCPALRRTRVRTIRRRYKFVCSDPWSDLFDFFLFLYSASFPSMLLLFSLLLCWWVQRITGICIMRRRWMFETWGRAAPWNRLIVDLSEALMSHWFHLLNPLSAAKVRRRRRRTGGRLKLYKPLCISGMDGGNESRPLWNVQRLEARSAPLRLLCCFSVSYLWVTPDKGKVL